MNLHNVMLDFETWGTRPGAALRSIGAVMFDPHGSGHGAEFYANIEDASCLDAGMHKEDGTVAFWNGPKVTQQARDSLLVNQRPVKEVAVDFNGWFKRNRGVFVWGQGASFDPVLWEATMYMLKMSAPWKYWDIRCTRTAYDMGGFNPFSVKRAGIFHNALDDSKHQVVCVQRAYAKVAGRLA